MTAVLPPQDLVRSLTVGEAKREQADLLEQAGMTRQELERKGDSWELDAHQRGILADIRSLEFLVQRATR
ncbi:hypothetical protein [Dietzia cinnamea]|uniref:hypothetical protein n=1 Tax=Dietzia cinnamea TaxID=321318 RepID=UPI00223A9FA5|nr:hypothetical protein [Dietzia cinnamea]MCT2061237.1 hypothetical protein [Dietzia cinnamea]MCT2235171.1 hypothetical protein [Dietzia cinnamea]